jgi:hypothetical protein
MRLLRYLFGGLSLVDDKVDLFKPSMCPSLSPPPLFLRLLQNLTTTLRDVRCPYIPHHVYDASHIVDHSDENGVDGRIATHDAYRDVGSRLVRRWLVVSFLLRTSFMSWIVIRVYKSRPTPPKISSRSLEHIRTEVGRS